MMLVCLSDYIYYSMTERMLQYRNGYKFSFKRYEKQDNKTGSKQTPRFVSIQFDNNKNNKGKISPAIQSENKNTHFHQRDSFKHRKKDNPIIQNQSNGKKQFTSLVQEIEPISDKKTKKNLHQLIRANSAQKIIQQSNPYVGKIKKDQGHIRSITSEKKIRHPLSNRILQKVFPTMKSEDEAKVKVKDNTESKQYSATIQKISEIKKQNLQIKKKLFKKPSNDKMMQLMRQWSEQEKNTKSKIQSIVYPMNFSRTKSKINKSTKAIRINTDDINSSMKDNNSVKSTSSLRQDTKNIYSSKQLRKTDRSNRTDLINPIFLPSTTNDISQNHLTSFNEFKNLTEKKNLIPELVLQSELIEEDNKTKLSLRSGVKLMKKPHKNLKITKIQQDYNKKINEILNKLHVMSVKTQAEIPQ